MAMSVEDIREVVKIMMDSVALEKDAAVLTEVQIQLNKNRDIGFGNIVILAGGAGSGKGMTTKNLLNVEGKVLDVDALKSMALGAKQYQKQLLKEFGNDFLKPDFMKDPENVSKIHLFVNDKLGLPDKQQATLFNSIVAAHPDRKPNIIFDVTLKDMNKLVNLSTYADQLGYSKDKIHLVWVLNTVEVAIHQNKTRDRVVREDILINTHKGASLTMQDILNKSDVRKYMDGDIFISFNQFKVDNDIEKSERGGKWLKRALYVQLKEAGKAIDKSKIGDKLIAKIKSYVPNPEIWGK